MSNIVHLELITALQPKNSKLINFGVEVGKLFTDYGLPIDISLDKLPITKQKKIAVLFGAQQWLIEHKRKSNASDKSIERQRKVNRESMAAFIKTGEVGIY